MKKKNGLDEKVAAKELEVEETHQYKKYMANKIKPISETDIENEFETLRVAVQGTTFPFTSFKKGELIGEPQILLGGLEFNERCRIGNNIVDFFTFQERLETRGKYGVTFYEFVKNIEDFKKKKFIQNPEEPTTPDINTDGNVNVKKNVNVKGNVNADGNVKAKKEVYSKHVYILCHGKKCARSKK